MATRQVVEVSQRQKAGLSLTWPGKQLSVRVVVPEMRLVETFEPHRNLTPPRQDPAAQRGSNLLLHGDNRETLAWLLSKGYRGRIKLIYIDPPFDSNNDYTSQVRLRGKGARVIGERVQYSDRWQGGDYLQFLAERLLLLRELLHPDGTIWLHCDHRASPRLHLLLEEIFGPECYLNTIAWRSQVARGAKVHARYFPHSTHSIHIFARSPEGNPAWHPPRKEIVMTRAEAAARYMEDAHGFFRTSHPGTYSFERLVELHEAGRLYAPYHGDIVVDNENRQVYASNGGNIGVKYYVEQRGHNRFVVTRAVDNLWDDIPGLGTIPSEDVNYPTQKTEGLLRRIIMTSTAPGDLVLDAFAGSGTSVAVAQKTGRRWIGCDDNWQAIRTTASRVQRAASQGYPGGQLADDDRKLGTRDRTNGNDRPAVDPKAPLFCTYQADGERIPAARARAVLAVEQTADGLQIEVEMYNDADLEQRLREAGESPPDQWRALVQSIAIDPDYDGKVFRAVLADAPAGKLEAVTGCYRISTESTVGTIATQIVNILGQETVMTWNRS